MKGLIRLGVLLVLAVVAALPTPAAAQSCSMRVEPVIEFGTIIDLPTPATTVTALIFVTCGVDERRICVGIGRGTGLGSTETDRRMSIIAPSLNTVSYALFKDPAFTQPFGSSGDDRATVIFTPTVHGDFAVIPVYGRLTPGQTGKDVGDYLSTLLVTEVSFGTNKQNCKGNGGFEEDEGLIQAHLRIGPNCAIVVAPLDFGTLGELTGSSGATNLSVTCTNTSPYSISLDGGGNSNVADRRMQRNGGGGTIGYQLYRDPAHSLIWGNTPGTTVEGVGIGVPQAMPVYGFVPAQAEPQSGAYRDTITATVTY